MQLDHFYPRSKNYDNPLGNLLPNRVFNHHHSYRLNLMCRGCNSLKSNLRSADFSQIIEAREAFFKKHRWYSSDRKERLLQFAEIYYYRLDPQCYASRHGIVDGNAEAHWEKLKRIFRERWPT